MSENKGNRKEKNSLAYLVPAAECGVPSTALPNAAAKPAGMPGIIPMHVIV